MGGKQYYNMQAIHVLIAVNDPGTSQMCERLLAEASLVPQGRTAETTYIVDIAPNLSEGARRLQQQRVDVFLLDLPMPGGAGWTAMQAALTRHVGAAVIVLTNPGQEALADQAVQQGAHDCLVKGRVDGQVLPRAIRYALERRRLTDALLASEERYQSIATDQTDLICRSAPDGKLTFVNAAYCRFWSRPAEALIGSDFASAFHEDDRQFVRSNDTTPGRDHPVTTFELRMRTPDGTVRWTRWTDRAIYDGQGNIEYLSVGQDISELREAEEKLKHLSTHDELTGLYNRMYFENMMVWLERYGQYPISVIIGDADGWSAVNEQLGKAAGDELLQNAAHVLTSSVRNQDIVARISQDEFAMLLPHADAEAAQAVLKRIEQHLAIHNATHRAAILQLSLGAATNAPKEALTETIMQAEVMMYGAKKQEQARRSNF